MTVLDEQFGERHGPIKGPFLVHPPDVIDVTGRKKPEARVLWELADTKGLCKTISDTAKHLSQRGLPNMLRPIQERALAEHLDSLSIEIDTADVVRISFPKRTTMYTNAYDSLIRQFGEEDQTDGRYVVSVPRPNIHSIVTQFGQASESSYSPQVLLRVQTGEEPPISIFNNGQVIEQAGQPRWFGFPLDTSEVATLNYY